MIGIPFANDTIKQAVAVFGSLFNNIVVKRKDGTIIPVPIAYGPRDKWLEAAKVMDQEEEMFEKVLPRISYEVVAMNYDQMRKLTNKQTVVGIHDGTKNSIQRISAPVPYNLDFTMYIQTKNLNDGWQIIEQIIPFFTPAYTVRVRHFPVDHDSDTPIAENEYDMPFTLLAVTWADDWTGDIADRRMVEWTLEFQTKLWFSPPTKPRGKASNGISNSLGQVILDSRARISYATSAKGYVNEITKNFDVDLSNVTKDSDHIGNEIGYVVIDSETLPVDFVNDVDYSPNVINTLTPDGVITRIIRDIDTF